MISRQYAYSLVLPESDPYQPWEKRFLEDPGTMSRYCRAAVSLPIASPPDRSADIENFRKPQKWKLPEAKTRIKGTMEWRREYKPELIKESDVRVEAETGKM
jgi:hypothetical protein